MLKNMLHAFLLTTMLVVGSVMFVLLVFTWLDLFVWLFNGDLNKGVAFGGISLFFIVGFPLNYCIIQDFNEKS